MIEQSMQVFDSMFLAVERRIGRNLRWRITASVVGNHAVSRLKKVALHFPRVAAAGEFVAKDQWEAVALDFIMEPHAVDGGFRHSCTAVTNTRKSRLPRHHSIFIFR